MSYIDNAKKKIHAKHVTRLFESASTNFTIDEIENIVDDRMILGQYDDEVNDLAEEMAEEAAREYDAESWRAP